MTGAIDQERVAEEISAISQQPREQLIKDWRRTHKQHPPKGISRRLLEYSAAYHLQVKAFGGLKPTVRRTLRQATLSAKTSAPVTTASKKSDRLSLGARLLREWHDCTYTVEVVDTGFLYEGAIYKSLSEVARAITGARWSGPRFFGL